MRGTTGDEGFRWGKQWTSLRRLSAMGSSLRFVDLTLDRRTRAVKRGERKIELTPIEFALLELFLENVGTGALAVSHLRTGLGIRAASDHGPPSVVALAAGRITAFAEQARLRDEKRLRVSADVASAALNYPAARRAPARCAAAHQGAAVEAEPDHCGPDARRHDRDEGDLRAEIGHGATTV